MRRNARRALAIAAAALAACGRESAPPAEPPVGVWQVADVEEVVAKAVVDLREARGDALTPALEAAEAEKVRTSAESARFEFRPDGTFWRREGAESHRARWARSGGRVDVLPEPPAWEPPPSHYFYEVERDGGFFLHLQGRRLRLARADPATP